MNADYPFHTSSLGRTALADEDKHIRNLIEQVLFTNPGERVMRPTFGSGLLQLVFAPNSPELAAATQLLVQGALQQWLGDRILVEAVQVESQDFDPARPGAVRHPAHLRARRWPNLAGRYSERRSKASNEGRRTLMRNRIQQGLPVPFAIDFLEVGADQKTLRVTFFQDIPGDGSGNPTGFGLDNLEISGGVRVTGIQTLTLAAAGNSPDRGGEPAGRFLHLHAAPGARAGRRLAPGRLRPAPLAGGFLLQGGLSDRL